MYYKILYSFVWLVSLLPLRVLYWISDFIYVLVYYVVKYRRDVVHNNLVSALPERSKDEIKAIEKKFYAFFADYIVETLKLCTISKCEMCKRVEFVGVNEMVNELHRTDKKFGFIYLAHYGNWEWVSSMALHIHAADVNVKSGQIYHPLRNAAFDRLFLKMRGRFGGDNIAMKETLRYILRKRQKNEPAIIGFIADQAPKWSSIHHWTDFLHHNTPVFTGTEQIAKQVDALLFYCHVERPSRGHYRCTITEITDNAKSHPDFELTDAYFARLAETINQEPALWLWSHKRWKRTYEEFLERQKMGLHG